MAHCKSYMTLTWSVYVLRMHRSLTSDCDKRTSQGELKWSISPRAKTNFRLRKQVFGRARNFVSGSFLFSSPFELVLFKFNAANACEVLATVTLRECDLGLSAIYLPQRPNPSPRSELSRPVAARFQLVCPKVTARHSPAAQVMQRLARPPALSWGPHGCDRTAALARFLPHAVALQHFRRDPSIDSRAY